MLGVVLSLVGDVLAEDHVPLVLVIAGHTHIVRIRRRNASWERLSLVRDWTRGWCLRGELQLLHHPIEVLLGLLRLTLDLLRLRAQLFQSRLELHLLRFELFVGVSSPVGLLHHGHEVALRAVGELRRSRA